MKRKKTWVYVPPRPEKPRIPETLKHQVQAEADRLVEEIFKPQAIHEPPEEPRFNYITDVYTRWFRSYLYFCATYACPGPNALSPTFEALYTRLEYAGDGRFNLAYMRHTGKWCEVYTGLSLADAIDTIRNEGLFHVA